MRYVGSKNKLSKDLVPIIQSILDDNNITKYVEPFVGGANMIDKIKCDKKIGIDIHEELIALLNYTKENYNNIQDRIYEEEYKQVRDNKSLYPKWKVGLVGFCASFGAKYFGGYARNKAGETDASWSAGAIRNLKKQAPNLKDIDFINGNYLDYNFENSLIYCDPPYKNTTKYKHGDFDYDKFYEWCIEQSKNNIVLVSEYNINNENFKEIWNKEVGMMLGSGVNDGGGQKRVERLYIVE